MNGFAKIVCVIASVCAGSQAWAEHVTAYGKLKSISAESKEFVLTDTATKDWTFKIGEGFTVNRDGKESATDMKVGDDISVCYDKGVLTWTAHYVLVHEGEKGKKCELRYGAVKSYDAEKKQIVFVAAGETAEWTLSTSAAPTLRLNGKEMGFADIKIGDKALFIVHTEADGSKTLKCMMTDRK